MRCLSSVKGERGDVYALYRLCTRVLKVSGSEDLYTSNEIAVQGVLDATLLACASDLLDWMIVSRPALVKTCQRPGMSSILPLRHSRQKKTALAATRLGPPKRSKEGNFLELTGRVDQSLRPSANDRGGQRLGPHEFDLLCQDVQDIVSQWSRRAKTWPRYFLGMTASALGNDGYVELTEGMRKLTDDENVTAWSRIVNWAEQGWIQKGFLGTGYEEAKALFANNQCAFASAGPDDFKGYLQVNPNGNWLWFPYPASPFTNKSAHVSGTDPNWFAYSKTDYPDEAVRFLDWAVHVEGQTAFMDLYGGLPSIKNMEIDDPVRSAMNRTPETMPGWWQRKETVNTGGPMGKHQAALFGGQMSVEEYAGEVQATIDELRM